MKKTFKILTASVFCFLSMVLINNTINSKHKEIFKTSSFEVLTTNESEQPTMITTCYKDYQLEETGYNGLSVTKCHESTTSSFIYMCQTRSNVRIIVDNSSFKCKLTP
jgi:hypothetical protein